MSSQAPPPLSPDEPVSLSIQTTAQESAPQLEEALENLVEPKQEGDDGKTDLDAHAKHGSKSGSKHAWLQRFFPRESVDKLFAHEHMGNFVFVRATKQEIFEEMPIYVRLGMHLLFVEGGALVSYSSVENLLLTQSIRQGKIYDAEGPEVLPHIQAFVDQFELNTTDLLEEDLSKYKSFNKFFSRSLKPTARPIASLSDPSVIVSQADCRLTVWNSVEKAKEIWIKGKKFSVPSLLANEEYAKGLGPQPSLAVFRLAPEDYHRFHSPVSGTLGPITHIPGSLYTVNPQAVNENLNVFTANSRSVLPIHLPSKKTIYVVAIGAMLVGSINWVEGVKEGKEINKGEELGWFSYGGSTVIAVLPEGWGEFDADLREKSEKGMEVLVRVGEQIGKFA